MRFSLAATSALAGSALALPRHRGLRDDEVGLNSLARSHGKLWFGTAADIPGPEQQDNGYMDILTEAGNFGEITPANYMKV